MDSTQAAPFKEKLLEMQASLLDSIALHRGGLVSRAEATAEHFAQLEDPQPEVAAKKEDELSIDEHEVARLANIAAALERIASGTYGQCIDCGDEIPIARLQAAPEALRCIACQEAFEKLHPPQ
ncbi:TraR/DksA family transcriptional regulator [Extensimonas vulgaris]|uniref:TraR/DksA family transcriptional regulator n=1 Tax=Extensimonas vulgaris TaxID=1031594 RepID=A0A369ALG9_9BURK|nr:TraR/DksA family transcriptional regulator [Extensimonas vulgaris]RCX10021.1 TraR/DksA family transcriptional regulator [Extensimonas vulgaris]TWI36582.1 TraR/DksA family transcriptional regulator [Extensimonas vulgaris]TXD17175.1 TraR/DksA family transcriptional regulator [Extensimonas vulgaris]